MRRNYLTPVSPLATAIIVLVAISLVVSVGLVFRREQSLRSLQSTASDRVVRSPLLPDEGWKTYDAAVWSMGYPDDWQIYQSADGVLSLVDPFTNTTYLSIVEPTRPLAALLSDFSTDLGVIKNEFLFAGYPATKFTSLNGQQDYFVAYNDRVIMLSTQYPNHQEVGIMLITFQFID
jgi:hypothetical protein